MASCSQGFTTAGPTIGVYIARTSQYCPIIASSIVSGHNADRNNGRTTYIMRVFTMRKPTCQTGPSFIMKASASHSVMYKAMMLSIRTLRKILVRPTIPSNLPFPLLVLTLIIRPWQVIIIRNDNNIRITRHTHHTLCHILMGPWRHP